MNPALTPQILFEDPNLIVIDKPSGLLSQGEIHGDPNVVDWLRERLGRPYVGLVHRLDRETSGLMVVAKRTKAAQRLTDALQSGELTRSYLAWVKGEFKAGSATNPPLNPSVKWTHWLLKDGATNHVRVVQAGTKGAKESVLLAKLAELSSNQSSLIKTSTGPLSLLEFTLETGRSHQIRVQSKAQGHPLLGDSRYGGPEYVRLALHSAKLSFPHPISKEILNFECPLPAELEPKTLQVI